MTLRNHDDEDARRAYWAEQMELGYALVEKLIAMPIDECGERFASIPAAAKAAGVEMRFSVSKIAGELDRVFFIRQSLVQQLVAIGREMNERGWILRIEDAFRSLEMQRQLGRRPDLFDAILQKCLWECGGVTPSPEFVSRRAIVLIANIPKIGTHMSGSAVDVSVLRRADGSEVWRGKPYLEMSEYTPMRSPFVDSDALRNRLEIAAIMEAHGFQHFPFEFWHFSQGDAIDHVLRGNPQPARFGPVAWDPLTNRVTPCEDPLRLLNPMSTLEEEIAAALRRCLKGTPA